MELSSAALSLVSYSEYNPKRFTTIQIPFSLATFPTEIGNSTPEFHLAFTESPKSFNTTRSSNHSSIRINRSDLFQTISTSLQPHHLLFIVCMSSSDQTSPMIEFVFFFHKVRQGSPRLALRFACWWLFEPEILAGK